MKKTLSIILIFALMLAMAACGNDTSTPTSASNSPTENVPVEDSAASASDNFEDQGYRIAYIIGSDPSDVFQLQNDAAKAEAESLGMTIDFYFAGADAAAIQDYFQRAINQGYDAIYQHGANATYSYEMIKPALDAGIVVIAMEYDCRDENGNVPKGVVEMKQDDQSMSSAICDYAANVLYPDKEVINVLRLYNDVAFDPFIRRNAALQEYVDSGRFNIIETVGSTDASNAFNSIYTNVSAILPVIGEDIDLIWSVYDMMAQGAYLAVTEAGMSIPIVTVDVSNEDLTYMTAENSCFMACASPAPQSIGQQAVRLIAMMLHGDEVESEYELSATLIPQEQLQPGASVTNLQDMVEGYGVSEDHLPDWMKEVKARVAGE